MILFLLDASFDTAFRWVVSRDIVVQVDFGADGPRSYFLFLRFLVWPKFKHRCFGGSPKKKSSYHKNKQCSHQTLSADSNYPVGNVFLHCAASITHSYGAAQPAATATSRNKMS